MVQIDFTRMDDDADLHNKYCALKPTLKSSRNSFQNSPLVPEELLNVPDLEITELLARST
jgi:hypothetical protein